MDMERPIGDVDVQLVSLPDGELRYKTVSDANGKFSFSEVAKGPYRIRTCYSNREPYSIESEMVVVVSRWAPEESIELLVGYH